ncbi:MAG: hypothetical protein FWC32_00615 [Firmicutes bacterium]|nr:hypothetical protein [Bacillota bacterium]
MKYFMHIESLYSLEKQEKWDEARKLLYNMWQCDKQNAEKLNRVMSECWYVLSSWEHCINTTELSYHEFKNTLLECTVFGIKNHNKHPRFLCVTGYMISLFPYLFYTDDKGDLYEEWKQKGIDTIRKSCEIDPFDHVAMVLNQGIALNFDEYDNAKRILSPELANLFPNKTVIEIYFKNILGSN